MIPNENIYSSVSKMKSFLFHNQENQQRIQSVVVNTQGYTENEIHAASVKAHKRPS